MNVILVHWKSTVQSLLTVIIGLSGISIPAGVLSAKQAIYWTLAVSAAKVVLGVFQKDAGVTVATVPGSPTPQSVPSHEVPDNPAAKLPVEASVPQEMQ